MYFRKSILEEFSDSATQLKFRIIHQFQSIADSFFIRKSIEKLKSFLPGIGVQGGIGQAKDRRGGAGHGHGGIQGIGTRHVKEPRHQGLQPLIDFGVMLIHEFAHQPW